MARKKDISWNCGEDGSTSLDQAQLAVLMDIRDELKDLNRLLRCENFLRIPRELRDIRRAVQKRKYTKRK